ncbi:tRNA dihydrouridine synthase DusB [Pseudoclavibacter sp. CFCC 13796]|uniref:tRNA dihydrouridine synthase DusB n=1 Tax=Pseudoclavibacter sp. CFCC 13796 TaxID=2615179 RepID=UPI001301017F|nr:tRNA dihydrouridine synthase DusB [Pseudoclavibacter sp. CFCC 13796]KAB1661520.1 tRNA dihydrouridine synthase DusB [Pseudoclavibacter sp. CFCC 13796]
MTEHLTASADARPATQTGAERRNDAASAPADVPSATRGLQIGRLHVDTPVELAPMAGITNRAFRHLARDYGGGIYVCEMITTRALVERNAETMRLITFDDDESPRSVQLYGVDPKTVGEAVRMIVAEDLADHIDLNFGCPVPKVTRKGGGAALPWKHDLFASIVQTAVRSAGDLPVTVKMRKGIDNDHMTFEWAAKAARDAGVAAVALHGRTAAEHYSGHADWSAIARLREMLPDVTVLGNGDIWSAEDAIRMVRETGVDGVVVGRGCLGRPWLFQDLERAFAAYAADPTRPSYEYQPAQPNLREVGQALLRHARLLGDFFDDEMHACRDIRKHVAWYFKGYPVGGELRQRMALVETFGELEDLVGQLDASVRYPGKDAEGPRGRAGRPKRPHLPEHWLESNLLDAEQSSCLLEAELDVSGG